MSHLPSVKPEFPVPPPEEQPQVAPQMSVQSPVDPRLAPPQMVRRKRSVRGGCFWMVIGGIIALIIPFVMMLFGFLFYLVFPPPSSNILILGMDARPGDGWMARTDAIMIMGVSPRGLDTTLLSVPRDLYLDTPGYALQRANAVNVLGEMETEGRGASLMQEAVAQNFGIDVDHVVRINFEAFTEFVDALGGIDIDVTYEIWDYAYPTDEYTTTTLHFEIGFQHMTGEQALAYARTRHQDDDYRRAERQQQVVEAIAATMLKPGSWPRLPRAMGVLFQNVDTDVNLLDALAMGPAVLFDAVFGEIDQYVIDRDYILRAPEGQAIPDYAGITPWLDAHFR